MFEFDPYHVLLLAMGASIVNSYWLPRFVPDWEPAASALLIVSGIVSYAFLPGMPAILDPLENAGLWERSAEFAVIVALFGAGIRIDTRFSRRVLQPATRLLLVAMPVTILAVAVAGQALAGLSLAAAVLIGAVLAPTDPVLAGDLQVGPPGRGKEHPVRLTLTTEAGMNDGLAFPFVHLAILLAIHGGPSHALLTEWLARDVVWRIAIGIAGGLVAGTMLGRIVFRIPHANPLAKSGVGVIALAAVFLCYGATELVEGYGFIAVFVAGLALRRTEPEHRYHHTLHAFVEPVEYAVTAAMLFLLGGAIVIVVPAFSAPVIGIAILLIFVIRPAAAWLSMLGTPIRGMARWDAAFFGVRGVGSIYYIAFASTHAAFERLDTLWAIVAATIFLSTIVHGLSAGFVARRYDDA